VESKLEAALEAAQPPHEPQDWAIYTPQLLSEPEQAHETDDSGSDKGVSGISSTQAASSTGSLSSLPSIPSV
jgi:hypothetical protein